MAEDDDLDETQDETDDSDGGGTTSGDGSGGTGGGPATPHEAYIANYNRLQMEGWLSRVDMVPAYFGGTQIPLYYSAEFANYSGDIQDPRWRAALLDYESNFDYYAMQPDRSYLTRSFSLISQVESLQSRNWAYKSLVKDGGFWTAQHQAGRLDMVAGIHAQMVGMGFDKFIKAYSTPEGRAELLLPHLNEKVASIRAKLAAGGVAELTSSELNTLIWLNAGALRGSQSHLDAQLKTLETTGSLTLELFFGNTSNDSVGLTLERTTSGVRVVVPEGARVRAVEAMGSWQAELSQEARDAAAQVDVEDQRQRFYDVQMTQYHRAMMALSPTHIAGERFRIDHELKFMKLFREKLIAGGMESGEVASFMQTMQGRLGALESIYDASLLEEAVYGDALAPLRNLALVPFVSNSVNRAEALEMMTPAQRDAFNRAMQAWWRTSEMSAYYDGYADTPAQNLMGLLYHGDTIIVDGKPMHTSLMSAMKGMYEASSQQATRELQNLSHSLKGANGKDAAIGMAYQSAIKVRTAAVGAGLQHLMYQYQAMNEGSTNIQSNLFTRNAPDLIRKTLNLVGAAGTAWQREQFAKNTAKSAAAFFYVEEVGDMVGGQVFKELQFQMKGSSADLGWATGAGLSSSFGTIMSGLAQGLSTTSYTSAEDRAANRSKLVETAIKVSLKIGYSYANAQEPQAGDWAVGRGLILGGPVGGVGQQQLPSQPTDGGGGTTSGGTSSPPVTGAVQAPVTADMLTWPDTVAELMATADEKTDYLGVRGTWMGRIQAIKDYNAQPGVEKKPELLLEDILYGDGDPATQDVIVKQPPTGQTRNDRATLARYYLGEIQALLAGVVSLDEAAGTLSAESRGRIAQAVPALRTLMFALFTEMSALDLKKDQPLPEGVSLEAFDPLAGLANAFGTSVVDLFNALRQTNGMAGEARRDALAEAFTGIMMVAHVAHDMINVATDSVFAQSDGRLENTYSDVTFYEDVAEKQIENASIAGAVWRAADGSFHYTGAGDGSVWIFGHRFTLDDLKQVPSKMVYEGWMPEGAAGSTVMGIANNWAKRLKLNDYGATPFDDFGEALSADLAEHADFFKVVREIADSAIKYDAFLKSNRSSTSMRELWHQNGFSATPRADNVFAQAKALGIDLESLTGEMRRAIWFSNDPQATAAEKLATQPGELTRVSVDQRDPMAGDRANAHDWWYRRTPMTEQRRTGAAHARAELGYELWRVDGGANGTAAVFVRALFDNEGNPLEVKRYNAQGQLANEDGDAVTATGERCFEWTWPETWYETRSGQRVLPTIEGGRQLYKYVNASGITVTLDATDVVFKHSGDAYQRQLRAPVMADGATLAQIGSLAAATYVGSGSDGADTLSLSYSNATDARLYGLGGDDTLRGNAKDNRLHGGDGADRLEGGGGHDELYGGAGNDLIEAGGELAAPLTHGGDVVHGGLGVDTLSYAGSFAGVTVDLAAGRGSGGDAEADRLGSIENVIGSAHADKLTAGARREDAEMFDATSYLQHNEKVAADILLAGHADNLGILYRSKYGTQRVPWFDYDRYLAANPDVAASAEWKDDAFGHWVTHGIKEGRFNNAFNVPVFLKEVGFVRDNTAWEDFAYRHWANVGYEQNLFGAYFDREAYLAANPEVAASPYFSANAYAHWYMLGQYEGRPGAGFDAQRYRELFPEIATDPVYAGKPYLHWLHIGQHVAKSDPQRDWTVTDSKLEGLGGNDILTGAFGHDTLDGGSGDDTLSGRLGNDKLDGGDGQDRLDGGAGDDVLVGGAGDDVLSGGKGADRLDGGAGRDSANFADAAAAVTASLVLATAQVAGGETDTLAGIEDLSGSAHADALYGDAGDNRFWGDGGNDTIEGYAGADTLAGAAGDDLLSGGAGSDFLDGGDGTDTATYLNAAAGVVANLTTGGSGGDAAGDRYVSIENLTGSLLHADTLTGDANANVIDGLGGNDTIWAGLGNDTVYGGEGHDEIGGNAGDDTLWGGSGNDRLWGDIGNDTLGGGDGDDQIGGHDGNDTVWAGSGQDVVWGNLGDDAIHGEAGDDQLWGQEGHDVMTGGLGNDLMGGGAGGDRLDGGDGNDTLYGDADDDELSGGDGTDTLVGDVGNDTLYGGNLADILKGGDGADWLHGGAAGDTLYGGAGNDTFVFELGSGAARDLVMDFQVGDRLHISDLEGLWVEQRDGTMVSTLDIVRTATGVNVLSKRSSAVIELQGVTDVNAVRYALTFGGGA